MPEVSQSCGCRYIFHTPVLGIIGRRAVIVIVFSMHLCKAVLPGWVPEELQSCNYQSISMHQEALFFIEVPLAPALFKALAHPAARPDFQHQLQTLV